MSTSACLSRFFRALLRVAFPFWLVASALGQTMDLSNLAQLTPGRTRAENALWIENPLTARFNTTNWVLVADLRGPAVITMIHFALPNSHFGQPPILLGRDLLLRMYWDGEASPSVEVPMVDFFCDPAGTREEVNTALVNKRRGLAALDPATQRNTPQRSPTAIRSITAASIASTNGMSTTSDSTKPAQARRRWRSWRRA